MNTSKFSRKKLLIYSLCALLIGLSSNAVGSNTSDSSGTPRSTITTQHKTSAQTVISTYKAKTVTAITKQHNDQAKAVYSGGANLGLKSFTLTQGNKTYTPIKVTTVAGKGAYKMTYSFKVNGKIVTRTVNLTSAEYKNTPSSLK